MRKIVSGFFEIIVLIFSIFILFGAISEPNFVAKIIYILAAFWVCPIIYHIIKNRITKKTYVFARVSGFIVSFILLIIATVFFADKSIDNKMVVDKGITYVRNKYYNYDTISIKKYQISNVEINRSKKIVKLELVFNVAKDSKIEKKKETCYVGYDEETGEYTLENYN